VKIAPLTNLTSGKDLFLSRQLLSLPSASLPPGQASTSAKSVSLCNFERRPLQSLQRSDFPFPPLKDHGMIHKLAPTSRFHVLVPTLLFFWVLPPNDGPQPEFLQCLHRSQANHSPHNPLPPPPTSNSPWESFLIGSPAGRFFPNLVFALTARPSSDLPCQIHYKNLDV